ncbi:MAG: YSC84-related protein [Myxococcales bacterium]
MGVVSKIALKLSKSAAKGTAKGAIKSPFDPSKNPLGKLVSALKKEATMGPVLHQQVMGALQQMQAKDPNLEKVLKKAYGFAVFPDVGKATIVLGGAFGMGEVFEHGRVIGYAGLVQITLGVQVGGQTYRELVVFDSKEALNAFKSSKVSFSANASVALVSIGAGKTKGPPGMRVFVQSEGGMMLEVGIGGQKFIYKPAALGRLATANVPKGAASQASKLGAPPAHAP